MNRYSPLDRRDPRASGPSRIGAWGIVSPALPGARPQYLRQIWLEVRNLVDARLGALSRDGRHGRDRFHCAHHGRTIAIYVCHVVLQISMTDIARAVGRHRTTIGYTCGVVEDRRDDPAFDDLVTGIENEVRLLAIFQGEPRS